MNLQSRTILIVDDKPANTTMLRNVLAKAGYKRVYTYHDAQEVMKHFRVLEPDIVLLDLHMPNINGLALLDWITSTIEPKDYLPVLILTADGRADVKRRALSMGAKDFLAKPFDSVEVLLRVRNLLETREVHRELEAAKIRLDHQLEEKTRKFESTQVEMLVRLAKAAEYRDDESGEHVWRVAQTASLIAEAIGLPKTKCQLLLRAARLHDIGKIAVPDGILLKAGRLSPAEYEVIKEHTSFGASLLSGSDSPLMQMAESIALSHHEHWNGSGYPRGLQGENIPIEGRILALADAFDAMTHDRSHRRAYTVDQAVAEIKAQSGKQFDPNIVNAFLELHIRSSLPESTTRAYSVAKSAADQASMPPAMFSTSS